MDYYFFTIANTVAAAHPIARIIAVFFATYAIFLLPLGIAFLGNAWKRALDIVLASAGAAYVINTMIGFVYFRPRPFVDHLVIQLIRKSDAAKSFPSDHAALAFAIAFALFFFHRRIGWMALCIAAFISIGRIMAGVHYPSDVLAGMGIGIASAYGMHRLLFRVRKTDTS